MLPSSLGLMVFHTKCIVVEDHTEYLATGRKVALGVNLGFLYVLAVILSL